MVSLEIKDKLTRISAVVNPYGLQIVYHRDIGGVGAIILTDKSDNPILRITGTFDEIDLFRTFIERGLVSLIETKNGKK